MAYFSPYIDETGLHMPTYEDRLADLVTAYRGIFGPDAELSASVPDYQLLSVFAKALDDASALVLSAFSAMNPLYAAGAALDLLAPLYGVTREAGETDAALRERMTRALAEKGAGNADSIRAAVEGALYVRSAKVYVNDTGATDARGIPGHSVAVVIYGGDASAVAKAIWEKLSPGVGSYGSASGTFVDGQEVSHTVSFSRAQAVGTYLTLTLRRLAGIDEDAVRATVTEAVRTYVNSLPIAEPLIVPRLYAVAYNADTELSKTFAVSDVVASVEGGVSTRDEVAAAWNQRVSTNNQTGVTVTFTD